jgi:hypothetical protein
MTVGDEQCRISRLLLANSQIISIYKQKITELSFKWVNIASCNNEVWG